MDRKDIGYYLKPTVGERINLFYASAVCLIFGHKKHEKMNTAICGRCCIIIERK